MYQFDELDEITRHWMMREFLAEEESRNPYRSTRLSQTGLGNFPELMKEAILNGNEESLAKSLLNPSYWKSSEVAHSSKGKTFVRSFDIQTVAETLAKTEFNTWYIRGLAKRLIEEGEEECEVYRAASADDPRVECLQHEGKIYKVIEVYNGHRAKYWPRPGNPNIFSMPIGTNCHHTIKRIKK